MASSAGNQHHPLPNVHGGGTTSAPPPTPSAQPNNLFSTAAAADTLSSLLQRLPPTLSLPASRRPPATSLPLVSLSNDTLLSSSYELGFFQLTAHSVPSRLANSAESEALSLFNLSLDQKRSYFPKNWPLGYIGGEEDDDGGGESLCMDSAESSALPLPSLGVLTRELERVGLRILELLSKSVGFENPIKSDPKKVCTLIWLSDDSPGKDSVRFYPYVVGLQYQIRSGKCSLLGDSGWVSVLPQVDSVLVTIGDIAQVWSNGKLKKVRGKPNVCKEEYKSVNDNNVRNISMTLLITLPLDAMVSPLLPQLETPGSTCFENRKEGLTLIEEENEENYDEIKNTIKVKQGEKRLFNSFSFEDYAWRVYHERVPLKDPLNIYRVKV